MLQLRWMGLAVLSGSVSLVAVAAGQAVPQSRTSTADQGSAAAGAVTRTVIGHVINGLTGAPLPRALINMSGRAMLTDAQGQFEFADFTEQQAYVGARKPGFSPNADGADPTQQLRITALDQSIEVKLYPDSLLLGTVTALNGDPIAKLPIRLFRLVFSPTGPAWQPVAFTSTDARGQYRFEQPGGRYRVVSNFMPRLQETGESVLPVAFPAESAGDALDAVTVRPGETREIDLRPRVGAPHPILIRTGTDDGPRGLRLLASGSSGMSFPLPSLGRGEPGAIRIDLPTGAYTIRAVSTDRDESLQGVARVTVTGRGVLEVPLQMVPAATFPVEITYLPSGANPAVTPAASRGTGLTLQSSSNDAQVEIQTLRADGPVRLMEGRYRLSGQIVGWYVESATCGTTNLLEEKLVVGQGAGGSPIRIVLGNATGQVHGTVSASVPVAGDWVYLIPATPRLSSEFEVVVQPDGSFRWTGQPGLYTLVAVDHRVFEDFRNPQFLTKFLSGGRAVEIKEGVDLQADVTLAVEPGR